MDNKKYYDNGVEKRTCGACPYFKNYVFKSAAGYYGKADYGWCVLYNKGNNTLNVDTYHDKPHPKCPLQNITEKKLKAIANLRKYKEGWVYYQLQKLNIKKENQG